MSEWTKDEICTVGKGPLGEKETGANPFLVRVCVTSISATLSRSGWIGSRGDFTKKDGAPGLLGLMGKTVMDSGICQGLVAPWMVSGHQSRGEAAGGRLVQNCLHVHSFHFWEAPDCVENPSVCTPCASSVSGARQALSEGCGTGTPCEDQPLGPGCFSLPATAHPSRWGVAPGSEASEVPSRPRGCRSFTFSFQPSKL